MKAIIAPITGAAITSVDVPAGMVLTVSAGKLAGTETVTFQLAEDGVAVYGSLYQDGELRQLTASNNAVTIPGPIDLVIVKSITTAAVGVYAKS